MYLGFGITGVLAIGICYVLFYLPLAGELETLKQEQRQAQREVRAAPAVRSAQPQAQQPTRQPQERVQGRVRYSTCKEARAAGLRKLTLEQVRAYGIRTRDGDGDGVYCE